MQSNNFQEPDADEDPGEKKKVPPPKSTPSVNKTEEKSRPSNEEPGQTTQVIQRNPTMNGTVPKQQPVGSTSPGPLKHHDTSSMYALSCTNSRQAIGQFEKRIQTKQCTALMCSALFGLKFQCEVAEISIANDRSASANISCYINLSFYREAKPTCHICFRGMSGQATIFTW